MPEPLAVRTVANGCTIAVRVHPGAKRDAFGEVHAGALKVAVTAPAEDGRANEALIDLFADRLRLPKSRIRLVAGASGRTKTLHIEGKSAAEVQAALADEC